MYQIKTASRRVEKEIASLAPQTQKRILQAIQQLSNSPRPQRVRKLAGELRGAWRIRVGPYRILYDIDDDQKIVTILAVLHRREAYR